MNETPQRDTLIVPIATHFEAGLPVKLSFNGTLNGQAITRQTLLAMKRRALRRRIWTVALDRLERGMLDVTIQSVDRVKSKRLAQVLMRILAKLTEALDHRLLDAVDRGQKMVARAAETAMDWGNPAAILWRDDRPFRFAMGLGILFGN